MLHLGSHQIELVETIWRLHLRSNSANNMKMSKIASFSRKVLISSIRQLAPYLIIGPRRLVLIGAIAAVALAIIFYPLIVQTPFDPERVAIQLTGVELSSGSESEQRLDLRVALQITNTNEFTLTTSRIAYDLFADGAPVGSDTISYEDVPVTGRPALFANQPVTISDTLTLQYTDEIASLFSRILNNSTDINWRISGSATIESGTTLQEKTFSSEL
jgi:hypothetical protein